MRASRIGTLRGVLVAAMIGLAAWLAPAVLADPSGIATTGAATSIAGSSAVFNGVIDPTRDGAIWFFQYSASPHFTASDVRVTPLVPVIRTGLTAVSAGAEGLAPQQEYWFRMVVAEPSVSHAAGAAPVYYAGHTVPLTGGLTAIGALSGARQQLRLRLRGDRVAVPLTCSGRTGAPCADTVSLTLTRRGLPCGSVGYTASAPRTGAVSLPVAPDCRSLIRRSGTRGARATLGAVPSGGSAAGTTRPVRIVG